MQQEVKKVRTEATIKSTQPTISTLVHAISRPPQTKPQANCKTRQREPSTISGDSNIGFFVASHSSTSYLTKQNSKLFSKQLAFSTRVPRSKKLVLKCTRMRSTTARETNRSTASKLLFSICTSVLHRSSSTAVKVVKTKRYPTRCPTSFAAPFPPSPKAAVHETTALVQHW